VFDILYPLVSQSYAHFLKLVMGRYSDTDTDLSWYSRYWYRRRYL